MTIMCNSVKAFSYISYIFPMEVGPALRTTNEGAFAKAGGYIVKDAVYVIILFEKK